MPEIQSEEAHLWRAVIAQALTDATSEMKHPKARFDRDRLAARQWFKIKSADFAEACALALLDPDAVRTYALTLIANSDSGIVEPTKPERTTPPKQTRVFTDSNGTTLTLREWATRCGLSYSTLYCRINTGWPFDQAIATAPGPTGPGRFKTISKGRVHAQA